MDRLLVFLLCVGLGSGQLIVNVKNGGNEVFRESIQANMSNDTITLDFQKPDGTYVVQFIDYKNVSLWSASRKQHDEIIWRYI